MPELPTSGAQPAKEPVIYTIPEQFYGVAAKAHLSKDMAGPGASHAAAMATVAAAPRAKGSRRWLLIPVIALVLLGVLAFLAWRLLQPKAAPAPVVPTVTLPEPEPAPQPVTVPEPATTTPEIPAVAVPSPEADTDGDGLTNAEEVLYGTNPDVPDSDGDGFSDSIEVTNLYNPAGFKPTTLIEAGLVKAFESGGARWLYPSSWAPTESGTDAGSVSFVASATETIVVEAKDAPSSVRSASDAYLAENPGAPVSTLQPFVTKSGVEGVRDLVRGSAYFLLKGRVYVFSDTASAGSKRSFSSTFTMMLASFSGNP